MATKKTQDGFDFLVKALRANKGAAYSDLRDQAEKKGLVVYPVMFGRAKAMLGLVKTAKRGEGKKTARAATRGSAAKRGGGSSKSDRIRELLRSGKSAAEIAKEVGCSVNLVYAVKARGGSSGRVAKRGPGRPPTRRSAGRNGSVMDVLETLREHTRERERMARALEQIRSILDSV
jgi:hypothetical protein